VSRAERLLQLLQLLRSHRQPVSGAALAGRLGISLRTLYRDIRSLQAQGAAIQGEAGLGFLLRPGFLLPPLMFSEDELEALLLGTRWVARRTDARLAEAGRSAMARIAAVLPADLRETLDASALLVGVGEAIPEGEAELPAIRAAIRAEQKLEIGYRDKRDVETRRTIWPFALGFFDRVRVVVAWCETRRAIRHFRVDRIGSLRATGERYPRRRHDLLQAWKAQERVPP
jgi:predicted DNA-binding transcriptional regulator YafY